MPVVGTKGQVVISKEIREKLGIKPGWLALERVVSDRVEIIFLPPEHDRSLAGALAKYVTKDIPQGEEWEKLRERAWAEAAAGGMLQQDDNP
ncbi:MAG: AbrB/MazE/SpoVT family DNA-binding domain-containing protein [Chloroflexota bacterium]